MIMINGKKIAAETLSALKEEVNALKSAHGFTPGLAVVLVGENPASKIYVRAKTAACIEAGLRSFQHLLSEDAKQEDILGLVRDLNESKDVHGILVQMPLPPGINTAAIIEAISPDKDVDGFHPCNMGRLMAGTPGFQPCTPMGIMRLIEHTGTDISGKNAVVVGRSNIVGKPIALMLLARSATVTICHSKTTDIRESISRADIVVAALGKPEFIKGDWIKQGAVVIDVGINRLKDGRLVGDVEFDGASRRASFITPVPGGVGPMTIAMLLQNTVTAAKLQAGITN